MEFKAESGERSDPLILMTESSRIVVDTRREGAAIADVLAALGVKLMEVHLHDDKGRERHSGQPYRRGELLQVEYLKFQHGHPVVGCSPSQGICDSQRLSEEEARLLRLLRQLCG